MTYKNFAINLAKKAGKMMKTGFVLGIEKTIKKDGSPVTKIDLAINNLVINEVKKYFPSHAVLGEEESHFVQGAEYVWVCDPIDGTIPFSRGVPTCMFSLALTHKGVSVLGAAFDPFTNRMFFAEKGKGAFLNNKTISVSRNKVLKRSAVALELWKGMEYPLFGFLEDIIFKKGTEIFDTNSAVYNGCLLAAGQTDGYVFPHYTAHDVAAIKVIVEEAGGKVTDLFGKDQRYDRPVKGCVLSNGLIHKELLKLIKKHLKI
jgi:myo-inositol-1(or 4)-monophosphatase